MIFTCSLLFIFRFFMLLFFLLLNIIGMEIGLGDGRSSYSHCTQFIKYNKYIYISAIKIPNTQKNEEKHLLDYQFN